MHTTGSRIALAALAAGIVALAQPMAAMAQDDHHGDHPGGQHDGGHPAGARPAGAAPQGAPAAPAHPAAPGGWNGGNRGATAPAAQPNHVIQGAPAAPVVNTPGQMHPDGGARSWQGNPGGARVGTPGWNGGGRTDPSAPGYNRFGGQGDAGRPGGAPNNGRPGGWNGQDQRPGGWQGDHQGGERPGGNGAPGRIGTYDPRPHGNYRAWSPQFRESWRGDSRYNWRDWRDGHRDAFHVGRYYAPFQGAYYSRLSIGYVLDPAFFGSSYWIYDPWSYHLPPAWPPYHWVRYYDDALLVDTYTGQVVDVLYDFFW